MKINAIHTSIKMHRLEVKIIIQHLKNEKKNKKLFMDVWRHANVCVCMHFFLKHKKIFLIYLKHFKWSQNSLNKLYLNTVVLQYQTKLLQHHIQEEQIFKWSIFAILTGLHQSSPLHSQSSWIFKLLHATLQQNDCTSSSFPVTLWP